MARRGPKPKPLSRLSPRRARARAERRAEPGVGAAPAWLEGEAAEQFARYAEALAGRAVGEPIDATALARLSRYVLAWRAAAAEGDWRAASTIESAMIRIEREFGFTPASRRGLVAPEADRDAERLAAELGIQR